MSRLQESFSRRNTSRPIINFKKRNKTKTSEETRQLEE